MSSHKIHLVIAKKINDRINMDLDSIMLGIVLPDNCNEKDHSISHYQEKVLERLANPVKFVEKYRDKKITQYWLVILFIY